MGEGLNDQSQPGGYPDTDQADYNQFKQFAFHVNFSFSRFSKLGYVPFVDADT